MEKFEQPFSQLPQALVEEVLTKSRKIGQKLYDSFQEIEKNKEEIRNQLLKEDFLKNDSELSNFYIPTTCGIDGAYAVEKLLAIDFVACAAVAVEGLIPPSEKKYWEKPHHKVFIGPERHNPDTASIIRGLMMEMEIKLAVNAPHDIVFLDGSLTTPLIYLNQAINKAIESTQKDMEISKQLIDEFEGFLANYKTILESSRSDKLWVGVPKYTTKRELGFKFGWPAYYDDRAILTFILEPGEFTFPIPLKSPSQPWHLKLPSGEIYKDFDEILQRIHILYYKPHKRTPALRLEISSSVASNNARLAVLLWGVKHQCGVPGVFEPYPLYIADKMAKPLSKAIVAFRQTATRQMVELHSGDIGKIFFSMHGYRTESGR